MKFNLPVQHVASQLQPFLPGKLLYIIYFAWFTLLNKDAAAQTSKLDRLKKVLPLLEDTARIDCLNELGFEYSNPYWGVSKYIQTDTAMLYTQLAFRESTALNYARGIAEAYQNIGMIAEERGNYILSESYTVRAIPILHSENMQPEFHRARINYGWCRLNRGHYNEAIEIFKEELPYYHRMNDTIHIAMINRMIGKAYEKQGYSELAFNFYEVDLSMKKTSNDLRGLICSPIYKAELYLAAGDTTEALVNYRIAAFYADRQQTKPDFFDVTSYRIYWLQKKFDTALFYLHQNIKLLQSEQSDSLFRKVALMHNSVNLSELYLELKQYDRAIFFGLQYLNEFTQEGDITKAMVILKNVATAYFNKADNARSLNFTNQLLHYAQQTGARPFVRDAYLLQSQIYENLQQLNYAYNWFKKYSALNSTLEKDNFKTKMYAWDAVAKMNAAEDAYRKQQIFKEEKNKAEIDLLTRDMKWQLFGFISAIVISILVMIIIIRTILVRRKKDRLQHLFMKSQLMIEKQQQEKEVMQLQQQKSNLEMQALRAQMNPHFIFNSLNSINMFILENNKLQASDYLSKFSKLIRLILQNSREAFIPLEWELDALKLYLELESLRFEQKFDYKIIVDEALDAGMLRVPPLIIQPYAENAIWHGLMQKNENGHLTIELYIKDELLYYEITDDGIGRKQAAVLRSKSAAAHKSMGMRITTDRLLMLQKQYENENAVLITDLILAGGSPGGTAVQIKIPVRYD